jgi:7-keto-8-aminopelargonate synthetase-like enzyme
LEAILIEHQSEGRVWLLVDGIYSMYGDIAPAAELSILLDRYPNLHIYCDDAHGFGWDGDKGRGSYLARAPWHERLVVVAGLSKSFGATGGVIVTPDPELAEFIELVGPPLTFGGPIPPASLGAAMASADIHLSDDLTRLQAELKSRIDLVNRLAFDIGIPLAAYDPSPIWYLEVGDYDRSAALCVAMMEAGFFLNGSAFPVVPHGRAGVRFTITRYNSPEQIEGMLTAFHEKILEIIGETEIVVDLTARTPVVEGPTTGTNPQ